VYLCNKFLFSITNFVCNKQKEPVSSYQQNYGNPFVFQYILHYDNDQHFLIVAESTITKIIFFSLITAIADSIELTIYYHFHV